MAFVGLAEVITPSNLFKFIDYVFQNLKAFRKQLVIVNSESNYSQLLC
jgi:hypothetical protein